MTIMVFCSKLLLTLRDSGVLKHGETKMFKTHLIKFILPLILLFTSLAQADSSFSRVFVFGDSLSDTGNLASVSGDFPAPFYMNRVSNGPVAVETLASKLGHTVEASLHLIGLEVGSNYAIAGANASGDDPINLTSQILSFHANHGFIAPEDALYVILIGGNDVRDARDVADWATAKSIIKTAATNVGDAIESLAQAGARSFLLINSPNIGLIPETLLIANATDNPKLVHRARKLSKLYRNKLHKIAEQLEDDSHINISEFDLFKFFNKLIKRADKFGFSNTTDACFSSVTFSFHPDCNLGLNFDQFIFFDEIHPTARVHSLVGEAFYKALETDDD